MCVQKVLELVLVFQFAVIINLLKLSQNLSQFFFKPPSNLLSSSLGRRMFVLSDCVGKQLLSLIWSITLL